MSTKLTSTNPYLRDRDVRERTVVRSVETSSAIKTIERLPDDAPLDEIVYRLFVFNKIRQGIRDIDAGRVISSEALAREIEQW